MSTTPQVDWSTAQKATPDVDWGTAQKVSTPQPAGPQNLKDAQDATDSLIHSRVFNKPLADTHQYHDELRDNLEDMGVGSGNRIWQDLKVGSEASIFGLMGRHQLPEVLQNPDRLDKFVSGLATMGADLPFMLMGMAAGGAAGSEVPIVGNALGASIGAFAVPAAIRQALVEGITKGHVKSFGDMIDRLGNVALEGTKQGAVGAVFHGVGLGTVPGLSPAASLAMRRLQQISAMTALPAFMEGRMPTADDFAVNAALFTAFHYGAKSLGLADITARKIHAKMLDAYEQHGLHPADLAAEALRTAQGDPNVDPIDRLNEMIRERAAANPEEAKPAGKPEAKAESEGEPSAVTEPPPPGLRPAVKIGEEVIPGGEGEQHTDVIGRVEGAPEAEKSGELERGFVDRDGTFHNREEAKAWVRENEPEVAKAWEQVTGDPNAEFHTGDYNEARQSTGIKNAAVDAQREQMGLPPIESPMRAMDPDNWDVAKEDVDSGRLDPMKIAESINRHPRGLSPEETNALNYQRARLSADHKSAMDAIEKAREADDPQAEKTAREKLRDVEDKINTVDEATKRAGTEWGLTGLMRQRMVAQDYSLDRLLQRARVASKTGEVDPEVREKLETLSTLLEEANKKVEELQNRQSEREAQKTVEKLKADTARTERKGERAQVRVELKVEYDNLLKDFDKILSGRLSANPFFDPEVLGVLGKLAKNRVESGLTRIEDIVDDIHGALTNIGYDVTKRDLRDAISGYGKTIEMSKEAVAVTLREARRQGKLLSALEDAEAKQLPLRSGLQRDAASDRVRELQSQVRQAMREAGIDVRKAQTPERQWRTALEGVKTRLRNQITDLGKQIAEGKKTPPREGIVYDEEAKSLQEQRDQLKEVLRQVTGEQGKRTLSPEQRIRMASASVEKQIAEYERRIKANDLTPAQRRAGTPDTPELKALRERLDNLRRLHPEIKEAMSAKKPPEQAALDRFKSYTRNRIADMERRLQTGDFTKEPQKQTVLDPEANALKAKAAELRNKIDDEIAKQKWANATGAEKAVHYFSKWWRFNILTSPFTMGKLTAAAMYRMGATPIEELTGGVLSKIPGVRGVAERAPFEGKPSVSAEAKALSQAFQKATADDVWSMLKTGETSLDRLFGFHGHNTPRSALDFVGNLHGALKVLPKRAEFFRRLEIGTQWALDHNLDIHDPKVQSALTAGAYEEANRAIFMNKNVVTSVYNGMLNQLHQYGAKGHEGAYVVEGALRFMFPIVKVPTNFAAEVLQYSPGGLAWKTVQLFRVLTDENRMGKSAMDNLSMHDMDNIMRGLKKGSVGLALLGIGYALRNSITGYYKPSQKRRPGEPGQGTITVGGTTIPLFLLENPALETLQLGATMGHVWDHYQMKGEPGGFVAGAGYSARAVASRLPFLDTPARMMEATRTPESTGVWAGQMAADLMTPLAVRKAAEWTDPLGDRARDRKPRTPVESLELNIPGLRENVPVRKNKRFSIKDLE